MLTATVRAMTQALLGDRVWENVQPWLAGHKHLDAAIGYVGSTGGKVLVPAPGSRVIVDGSAPALAQGMTSPTVLGRWVRAGVQVASLAGLHAKCMVITPAAGRPVAVIGSANASQHSTTQLRELAVLLDSEELVAAVGAQLDVWWAQADPLDAAWLAWAATVYQRPKGRPPRRRDRASVVNPAAPLWLRDVVDERVTFDQPVAAKLQAFREHHTSHEVAGLGMSDGEAKKIHVGDTVVLYTVGESGPPHGNARADAPAIVARLDPVIGAGEPVAFLVRRPGLPTRRVSEIARAVGLKPADFPVDEPITDQARKDAVFALWPQRP